METLVCPRCSKVVPIGAVLGILHRSSGPRCGTCRAPMQQRELAHEQVRALHRKHELTVALALGVFVAFVLLVVWFGEWLRG